MSALVSAKRYCFPRSDLFMTARGSLYTCSLFCLGLIMVVHGWCVSDAIHPLCVSVYVILNMVSPWFCISLFSRKDYRSRVHTANTTTKTIYTSYQRIPHTVAYHQFGGILCILYFQSICLQHVIVSWASTTPACRSNCWKPVEFVSLPHFFLLEGEAGPLFHVPLSRRGRLDGKLHSFPSKLSSNTVTNVRYSTVSGERTRRNYIFRNDCGDKWAGAIQTDRQSVPNS